MSKLVFDFNELNAQQFLDGGSGVTGLFFDASGALESTAGGIRVKAVSITDGMLAGSISSSKLTDEANIAFLNQTETISAAWDYTTLPTLDADATNASEPVRLSQLQALLAGLVWLSPNPAAQEYIGNLAALAIEALSPVTGDTYVVTAATGAGDLTGAAIGDVVEYDGANWQVIIAGVGGFVATGTRLVTSGTTALIAPLTDGADDNKYVDFDGALSPSTLTAPVEGNVYTVGDSDSVNLGNAYQWNAGSSSWIAFNAGVTDHGALTGLSDDDHSIYALLAGRSGGQTLIGGVDASDNLVLQSTSNATRGIVQINDDAQVVGNLQIDGQAYTPITTLADAATIATDCDLGNSFEVTLTATRILGIPTNLQEGATYIWAIDQGAGGFGLSYEGSVFNFKGGGVPSLSSSANAVDLITALYRDGVLEATIVTQDDLGVATHAASHIQGGGDEIDGDLLDIDYAQSNYTPATTGIATDVNHLAAHLEGIDDALGAVAGAIPDPYYHTVSAGEVFAGFFTLTTVPFSASKVAICPVNGIPQINAQLAGSPAISDYDVNVDGAGTVTIGDTAGSSAGTLSDDLLVENLVLLITYQG